MTHEQPQRTLVFAHHADEDHLAHESTLQFAERVATRTNGALEIKVVSNNALGTIPRVLRDLREGKIDMALPPHDRLGVHCPKFGCMSLPFVFDNYEHANRLIDADLSDWTTADLAEIGLIGLSNWDWGFRQITNNKRPILTPDDMAGLKFRVPPLPHYELSMKLLGATPIAVDLPQLVRVLHLGQIDGQENPISVILALKLYQFQKYMSLINYSYGGLTHVINKNTFEQLPFIQQQVLREESRAAAFTLRQIMKRSEHTNLELLVQAGMRVDMTDIRPFKAKMKPAIEQLGPQFGIENLNTFMELVEKHGGS
ncbi:MAG: C4-dicarboxylate transporter substrate-binding protein [Rhodocyclales bacterium]|nr:C4-dicarboxylate transporter substrate-binding protein [Rhodocyclales bacterium]